MQAYANWNASTEAAGNLTEREKGSYCFLIIVVSYNARYAKLRGVKNTHFPDFWRFSPGWLIFRLDSTALHILHFLPCFIVLFVSHFQMLSVLCAASLLVIHFAPAILFRQASLCACFITFHVTAVVVQLLLCRHYFACFDQIVSYVWMLTAYNVNYKDLWL